MPAPSSRCRGDLRSRCTRESNGEKRNLITRRRGLTDILDGKGLEAVSCECYAVVKEEYDRLLGIPNHDTPPH